MVKKLTKRFTAFFLAIVFTAMLLPTIPAMAETSGTCGENLTWTLDDDGTLTISGTGEMDNWNLPWHYNRENIKTAVIESGVTSIGGYAFEDCSGLTSVTIPDSVTNIGDSVFLNCSGLTSINVDENNEYYCSVDGNLFNKDKTELIQYAIAKKNTSYTIPNSVTSIGGYVFYKCSSLTSITIPDSVASIGDWVFFGCSSLTTIVVDESNEYYCSADGNLFNKDKTVLVQYAVGKTDSLYTIPDSVINIGKNAFNSCSSIINIIIPDSVASINLFAFSNCNSLTSIDVDENNEYYCSVDGNLFNKDKTELIRYAIAKKNTSYTIPNSVTNIGAWAFSDSSLTSVTIPDSVTSIGDGAFSDCAGLTNVTIPDSVTSIGYDAFEGCAGLTNIYVDENNKIYCSVDGNLFNKDKTELIQYAVGKANTSYTIPDSVTSIGGHAFVDCTGLTSVTIPDSVTEIGWGAFEGCTALTDVYYTGTEEQWNAIGIDGSNTPLTKAKIHYSCTPTTAEIPTVGEYTDKLDIVMTKTGGEVKTEITAKGETAISADEIQVFAMPTSGNATMLAPTVDGDKIVYSGNVSGDDYRIFVWTKDMVPITNVFDN